MANHINLITFLGDLSDPFDSSKLQTCSPFHNQLEQVYATKDKNGKFQVKDFQTMVEMLEYDLFVHAGEYRNAAACGFRCP
jgi:hypothetical protein